MPGEGRPAIATGISEAELDHGITIFLEQLIKTLMVEQTSDPMQSRKVSGPSGGGKPALSEIGETAAQHGKELLRHGFTVEEVVHDYGDLCQAITDLAFEQKASIGVDEFRTLNRCLDNAIANAVTEFGYQRDFAVADLQADALMYGWGFSPTNCATCSARQRSRSPSSRKAMSAWAARPVPSSTAPW